MILGINIKGGGKTTTAIYLGSALAAEGKRSLIDLDRQAMRWTGRNLPRIWHAIGL